MSAASLLILILLDSVLPSNARGDNTEIVKEGIKAGEEIIRFLDKNSDFNDFFKMSDQFTPFFDGLGGVISNQKMRVDYLKLEEDFSTLEQNHKETRDLFNSTSLRDNYLPSIEIIDIYLGKFIDTLKAPVSKDNYTSQNKDFTDSYKIYFDDSAEQILKGINSSIPKAIMCQTRNNRQLTRNHIKGIIFLLFKGVRVTLAFHKFDDPANYAEKSKFWVEKLKAVVDDTQRQDNIVKSNWLSQAETDIDLKYAKSNDTAKSIANDAYSFLSKKYSWRDWFVAVFSPLDFSLQYYDKYCDAFAFMKDKEEKQQWNILVASVNKVKKKSKVESMLKSIESKNRECITGRAMLQPHNLQQRVSPRDIFENQVPARLKGKCDVVNVLGIIRHDVKVLETKAADGRLFRVDGKCIKVFAFG